MNKQAFMFRIIFLICLLLLTGCFNTSQENNPSTNTTFVHEDSYNLIDQLNLTDQEVNYINLLKEKDAFVVAMRQVEAVYIINNGKISGFHYKLIKNFADHLDLDLKIEIVDISDYWKDENGDVEKAQAEPTYTYKPALFDKVDMYCDSLTVVPWRKKLVQFIEVYPSREFVINSKDLDIQTMEDLRGRRIAITMGGSYRDTMERVENQLGKAFIHIKTDTIPEVLPTVNAGEADFTFYDSSRAFFELQAYENLKLSIPATDLQSIGWALPKDNEILASIIEKYLNHMKDSGEFSELWEKDFSIPFYEYVRLLAD